MQFTTFTALVVAASMTVLFAMAVPTPACDTICPAVYQPVCAKAKTGLPKSFSNPCELKYYNCKHPNANSVVVANSNCKDIPAPAPKCDFMCTMDDKPVCGKAKDGKTSTFSNSCILALHNCQHPTDQFELIANNACPATACPTACPMIYKPVCAKLQSSESRTFGNSCELNVFNCENPNEKAKLVSKAECPAVATPTVAPEKRTAPVACPTMCPMVFKPVCAKNANGDFRTFGNKCQMGIFICKNPSISFTSVTEGACAAK
ncbi:hypothetical protein BGZ95_002866 [Linnemannia exigua]|uniref:Kazal-like domain-containing protein n=1 Tax=Linnemannia exigua TaxID=604196 RepID=A0AAD4D4Y0_9FUNG|nr:hypothetical protein BGZ95_002866 [Linnemannia exigua]